MTAPNTSPPVLTPDRLASVFAAELSHALGTSLRAEERRSASPGADVTDDVEGEELFLCPLAVRECDERIVLG